MVLSWSIKVGIDVTVVGEVLSSPHVVSIEDIDTYPEKLVGLSSSMCGMEVGFTVTDIYMSGR